ncbi:hypothetical protein [Paraflavitalea speifideaquila]|uniref:RNA polymerase sigma factor n=1 Tax=Paraflavitalea speifideaquila TaxID=3076558 RepID=UPI0028F15886|nr:hypothetical protein [Paraflavitalea speifideiaquila]
MTPTINDTETNLLSLLRAGDEQAFTQIYNLYWEKLFFIAHKRLHAVEDAKEIVQNVFLHFGRSGLTWRSSICHFI